jgi:ribulose-5-phosphate 4-epimerase/fuculose-1-phosphate aldolase
MDKLPNYRTDFRSIRDEVSPAEWQARVELAACYRLIDLYGMTDLTYNHITLRVPGPEEHILINLYGMLYKEITASSLAKIDLDGNVIWKPATDYYVNKAGYVIHGCIHRARSDVRAVIHTHTRAGMAVAAMQCGLLPISQTSIRFENHLGYHDYEGPAVDLDEQKRLVSDLGPHEAMLLRNHGLLSVCRTIAEAFVTMYWLDRACQAQALAISSGKELRIPDEDVVRTTNDRYKPGQRRRIGELEWSGLLRLVERKYPGFRD